MLDDNKGKMFSEFGMSLRHPITESFLIKHSHSVHDINGRTLSKQHAEMFSGCY